MSALRDPAYPFLTIMSGADILTGLCEIFSCCRVKIAHRQNFARDDMIESLEREMGMRAKSEPGDNDGVRSILRDARMSL